MTAELIPPRMHWPCVTELVAKDISRHSWIGTPVNLFVYWNDISLPAGPCIMPLLNLLKQYILMYIKHTLCSYICVLFSLWPPGIWLAVKTTVICPQCLQGLCCRATGRRTWCRRDGALGLWLATASATLHILKQSLSCFCIPWVRYWK